MLGLAIWDARQKKLVLARARLGKKPLYFALARRATWIKQPGRTDSLAAADRLLFGSELKALIAHGAMPRDLDQDALVQYLAAEYVPSPGSILEAAGEPPRGHVATFRERSFPV